MLTNNRQSFAPQLVVTKITQLTYQQIVNLGGRIQIGKSISE